MRSERLRLLATTSAATGVVIGITWAFGELVVDDASRAALRTVIAFAALLGGAVAVAFAELVSRRFLEPLAELRRTADGLAEGAFDARVRARRDDAIGGIGRAIDRMADQLAERVQTVQAQEARLRVVLDAMEESVLVMDADGRIVLNNASFERLTGTAGTGRTAMEAIRSGELHDAVVATSRTRSSTRVELELETARERRCLLAHVVPLPGSAGVVVVLHDITELRRLDAVRRDFVANASHELRTPLTAIRGFAETLRDGAIEEPRIAKRFVGNIAENAIRLQRIVDDLLELSRSESPEARFELEAVDPLPIASKVLAALEGKASDKGIQIAIEGAGEVVPALGEARALDQVLMNLVDNGIKYTPSGGRVVVRFGSSPGRVTIEVEDTGPGIAASHLPRIFERFYRVDAGRSREQGGTGLGLAIVKHLTQRMSGEVTVESRLGHGTTFRVSLARAPVSEPGREASSSHVAR